jgi:glycosyltransferase involved in cell wall biosynthesis
MSLTSCRIVLDCRWLGLGGAGRATELLLQELRREPPPGSWLLWGPERVGELAFPRSEIKGWSGDPRTLAGQRDWFRVPSGDVTLYMHQIRPLRQGPSVTLIHDTIPLRHGGNSATRLLKKAFFVAAARVSTHILTVSQLSCSSIVADLGVERERITILKYPIDEIRVRRIVDLRRDIKPRRQLLYVGRFARHKNLQRLCVAFGGSDFSHQGGRLRLVGGTPAEAEVLRRWLAGRGLTGIAVAPACGESELDQLLAESSALIMPSLEEGYGMPAYEAVAAGLPVAVTPTGAMPGLPRNRSVFFDPLDVRDIQRGIDTVTRLGHASPQPLNGTQNFRSAVLTAIASALTSRR